MCILCNHGRAQKFAVGIGGNETPVHSLSIAPEGLIDNELVAFTQQTIATDGVLDYYLHARGGAVTIDGGGFGKQIIQSLEIPSVDLEYFISVVDRLDAIIDLDFRISQSAALSDVDLFYDAEIDLGGEDTTLGLAITSSSAGWELFVNYPEVKFDDNYRRYVLIHEFGHSLGLEHPFDDGDGDTVNGIIDPWSSLFPEDTVMAYRNPKSGNWPEFYTDNDLNALLEVWGQEISFTAPSSAFVEPNLIGVSYRLLSSQSDVIIGSDGVDWINGSRGEDRISGGSGNDQLRGGKDNDDINGNLGNDQVYGDLGDDKVRGGKGDDFVNGNKGNDRIYGDFGNDQLRGGKNDDWIDGGPGDDQIWGDRGADRIRLSSGYDLIWGFSPADGDRLEIPDGLIYRLGSAGDDLQINTDVGNTIIVGISLEDFQDGWIQIV